MAITQIADLAQARQQQATSRQVAQLSPDELPELTQEFIVWHEEVYGPLVNTNYASITKYSRQAQNKALRLTRRAVARLIYMGIDFVDIEPLLKEGIFIYTREQIAPSTVQGTAKPIQDAEIFMIDYYYSVGLIKA